MKVLITGGCGFLGSNLAARALMRGDELVVFDNLSREGASLNLSWLKKQGSFHFVKGDIRSQRELFRTIKKFKPEVIFHLAGQVAMTTSISDPRADFEINVGGSINLLEAARAYVPDAAIIYSSTNKVYGDLRQYTYRETETRFECVEKPKGFDENTPLEFTSPYGCSKGAADQYMLDYARVFGLKTVVFRHSSMYGGRQFATYDQGWIGWFCEKALETKNGKIREPFTISGSGKQVRDVLHADDMVQLYFGAIEQSKVAPGQAFNVGGGVDNSLSLLELFKVLEGILGVSLVYTKLPPRQSDQQVFVADYGKAKQSFGWEPKVDKITGIKATLDWIKNGR